MSAAIDLTRAAAATRGADQLRDWLLHGPVQQHDGGIAGVIASDRRSRYVYGEITGYYLHWLAQSRSAALELRRERAARALSWVETNFRDALPPTRIVQSGEPTDWRNGAQFLFDLAMLGGGLAQATRAGLITPDPSRMRALGSAWDHFVDDGRLVACRWSQPELAPAPRWSTSGGPFLAKAASRALMAERLFDMSPAFADACRDLLQSVHALGVNAGIGMLHPTLYAIEGAATHAPLDVAAMRSWLTTLLSLQDADGTLPETPGVVGARRSDVAAQALRLGSLLGLAAEDSAPGQRLARLADALIARTRGDGIAFDPSRDQRESNVWCAMFAEQALRAYAAACRGDALPFSFDEIV